MRYIASESNYSTLVFPLCPFFERGLDPSALASEAWLTLARPNVVSTVYPEVEPDFMVGRSIPQLAVEKNPTHRSSRSLRYGTKAIRCEFECFENGSQSQNRSQCPHCQAWSRYRYVLLTQMSPYLASCVREYECLNHFNLTEMQIERTLANLSTYVLIFYYLFCLFIYYFVYFIYSHIFLLI